MKEGQLALTLDNVLVRIESIFSTTCIYCRMVTGKAKGGLLIEYESSIKHIPDTETLVIL